MQMINQVTEWLMERVIAALLKRLGVNEQQAGATINEALQNLEAGNKAIETFREERAKSAASPNRQRWSMHQDVERGFSAGSTEL